VYRLEPAAAALVATSRRTGDGDQVWVDRSAAAGRSYTYCVTAVDRLWNEGSPSEPRPVR